MMHPNALPTALFAGLMVAGFSAHAETVTLDDFSSAWQNSTGGSVVSFPPSADGDASVRWGVASTAFGQSGYDFDAADSAIMIDAMALDTPFLIGTFSHTNNPVEIGTSISMIDLAIDFDVFVGGVANPNGNPVSFLLNFSHNETDDAAKPCANGGANGVGINIAGCADIVNVSSVSGPIAFVFEDVLYEISFVGLSLDGGMTTLADFETRELDTTSAGLYARVTAVPVPEPETWAMLLAGLGLVGFAVRRRKHS